MTRTQKDRDRIQFRPGSPAFRMKTEELSRRTGMSESHMRLLIKNGGQVGEPVIAALLANTTYTFYELFEVITRQGVPLTPVNTLEAADQPDTPTSWDEAIAAGLQPEPGPPLLAGSTALKPDRIVLYDGDVPVLAFQQNDVIITYRDATTASPVARQVLAYLGHDLVNLPKNNLILPKKEKTTT